jgi:hypothetical protein
MIKNSGATGDWNILDNMRGLFVRVTGGTLRANTSDAEFNAEWVSPTATGFTLDTTSTEANASGNTYIYIAIRRGPMRVPTTGTSVFGLNARTGTGADATVTGGAGVTDLAIIKNRGSTPNWFWASRMTKNGFLSSNATTAEISANTTALQSNPWDVMDGVKVGTTSTATNASGSTFINYLFKRAPGFMDVCFYTGTGATGQTINHNLGFVPEFYVAKVRSTSGADGWQTYWSVVPNPLNIYLPINSSNARDTNTNAWQTPTSTQIKIGAGLAGYINAANETYVAYLFASAPGVSKVGSYTGNDDVQTINCGFTGGARFVMIKRTDSAEDWFIFDTARGINVGDDKILSLNTTAAEVTNRNNVSPASVGFEVNNDGGYCNASGGTYIFLAIA